MSLFGVTPATRSSAILLATIIAAMAAVPAAAEPSFDGPTFRKGLWRFVRTLEVAGHVRTGDVTRCVDPTNAMRGTFSSPDVGKCRTARPDRVQNRYTFENRCDYLGPVRTDITVHSAEAYTELNILKSARFKTVDRVVARRIGDCDMLEQQASSLAPSEMAIEAGAALD